MKNSFSKGVSIRISSDTDNSISRYHTDKSFWKEFYKVKAFNKTAIKLYNSVTPDAKLSEAVNYYNESIRERRQAYKLYKTAEKKNVVVTISLAGKRKSKWRRSITQHFGFNTYAEFKKSLIARVELFKKEVKASRESNRVARNFVKTRTLNFFNDSERRFEIVRVAWAYERPNTFLNLFITKRNDKMYAYKAPSDVSNHVGVELEFFAKAKDFELVADFYSTKFRLEGDTKDRLLGDYLCIKRDGSIRADAGYHPNELCVLAKETEIKPIIELVCKVLAKYEAKVNKTCGMHVHLDARNRNREVMFNNLVVAQPLLYAMNPKTRKEGNYCREVEHRELSAEQAAGDRYRGINAQALSRHNTIEIRIHSGTVNAEKINNWISILLAIVNKTEKIVRAPKKFLRMVKTFGLDKDLIVYSSKRMALFFQNEQQGIELEEVA